MSYLGHIVAIRSRSFLGWGYDGLQNHRKKLHQVHMACGLVRHAYNDEILGGDEVNTLTHNTFRHIPILGDGIRGDRNSFHSSR